MSQIIALQCRACEGEIAIHPTAVNSVTCPNCKKNQEIRIPPAMLKTGPDVPQANPLVIICVCCGHEDLYVQKDFNRQAGLLIVGVGIALSLYFFSRRDPFYAMAALGLTALIDFLVYFFVGDVTVCYSCHALYRGFGKNPGHEPFDLKKLEKYGGRTPRFGV